MARKDKLKPFKKGQGGRPKGSRNKIPADVAKHFKDCFEALGGVDAMVKHFQSARNKTAFYTLYAKMMPKIIETPDLADNHAARLMAAELRMNNGFGEDDD